MPQYNIIGLMSGTSLDGLDIVCCQFSKQANIWKYEVLACDTIDYSSFWIDTLSKLMNVSAQELIKIDAAYGDFLGKTVNDFINKHHLKVNFIASHGHTIFHMPKEKYGLQIGKGEAIYAATSIPVIYDFRALDIALGGQGAPLVPVGDLHLFSEYTYCLNLGGIANISEKTQEGIIAYDICPCNMILNYLANKINLTYDESGKIANSGKITPSLVDKLNALSFYQKQHPKSLGREWVEEVFIPLLESFKLPIEDYMASCVEHIALQISYCLRDSENQKMLITGGGTFHSYLIQRIKHYAKDIEIVIPTKEIIDYKEAIIFAFLGLLKIEQLPNCLSAVTGATKDSSGGKVIGL